MAFQEITSFYGRDSMYEKQPQVYPSGYGFWNTLTTHSANAIDPQVNIKEENLSQGQENPRVHISTNGYYGNYPKPHKIAQHGDALKPMDCEMTSIPHHLTEQRAPNRKRCHDDVGFGNHKRYRQDEVLCVSASPAPPLQELPPLPLVRPAHNTPDISRCLMAHMI